MAQIGILYCKRIQDHSCVACVKCFKAIQEKNGEFGSHDEIELIAMTDCGDCPGLVVPRVKQINETIQFNGRSLDVIHLGTCMKTAMETAGCPIDFDELKPTLEKKFGVEVILGTHSY